MLRHCLTEVEVRRVGGRKDREDTHLNGFGGVLSFSLMRESKMCLRYSEVVVRFSSQILYFLKYFSLIRKYTPQDFLTTKHSLDVESEQAYVVRLHYVIAPLASHFTCLLDGLLVAKLHQIII